MLIRSSHSQIPRYFNEILKRKENKTRLIKIVKDELIVNESSVLQKLKCQKIDLSMDQICYGITKDSDGVIDDLSSNQDEANTKLMLHARYAIEIDGEISFWFCWC